MIKALISSKGSNHTNTNGGQLYLNFEINHQLCIRLGLVSTIRYLFEGSQDQDGTIKTKNWCTYVSIIQLYSIGMLYFHHPLKTESPIMSKVLLFVPTNSQLRHSSKLDHLSPKVVLITNMLRRKNGATLYIYYEQMTSLLFLVQTSCKLPDFALNVYFKHFGDSFFFRT